MPIIITGGGGSSGTNMTLAELRSELKSRLPDFLSDVRANRLLSEAYQEICEMEAWPFLHATATGAPPLAITDLREIIYVNDTTNTRTLQHEDPRTLADWNSSYATQTGTPSYYWFSGDTINVSPTTTSALSVLYLRVPADLSSDADTPVVPSRFQLLIVDLAQYRALSQGPNPNESNIDRAAALKAYIDRRLDDMRSSLLAREAPDFVLMSGDW